ncbi:MAG TPA: MBL fold metallo-hydrolase, partial [Thiotrichales bacterium]|nr:MBL fold metallo-hydrolase [Thiotrichales bacterium]
MIRFALLGSGSRGNATLVECGRTRVLVDCGFSVRELERRLSAIQVDPATIDA